METATFAEQETSLQIRRTFPQPIAAVYAAWTDPEQIKHWMGPSDSSGAAEVTMDLRVGGRYRFIMHTTDGETHRVEGAFREIVPNRKIVYTWAWHTTPDRESQVTVEFASAGTGTELILTHQRFADADARDRHHKGWDGCLDRFGRFLSR